MERGGASPGLTGGFSRQQHKVPRVILCAFGQLVKGDSKVKKSRANGVNEANAGMWHLQGNLGPQGAAFLFSHLPLGHSGGCFPADAFTRLMGGVGEGPGTSPGITTLDHLRGSSKTGETAEGSPARTYNAPCHGPLTFPAFKRQKHLILLYVLRGSLFLYAS